MISEDKNASFWLPDRNKLIIAHNIVFQCINSYGQLDLHFGSYLSKLLLPTNQYPILLAYTKNPK